MTYLGIDIGTSEVKAILTDDAQTIVASAGVTLRVSSPHPGWSEQNPEDWWHATLDVIAAIRAAQPVAFSGLRGIALSGQMHGATLLDKQQHVLRAAILWNDTRAFAECVELEALVPESRAITGNQAMPGFTAPKLLWLQKYEPSLFRATAKVLLPKDYVALRLTGEYVSDMSDASGTLWLDVAKRDWSERMLAATGLTREHMPRLVEGSAAAAQVRPVAVPGMGHRARGAAGRRRGRQCGGRCRPGRGGAGRRPAVAGDLGRAVRRQRRLCTESGPGRARVLPLPARALAPDERDPQRRVQPQLGGAADAVERHRRIGDAGGKRRGAHGARLFLPYLSGERTPHNDARHAACSSACRRNTVTRNWPTA